MEWTGSPAKKASASFPNFDENERSSSQFAGLKRTSSALPLPLSSSRFANRLTASANINNQHANNMDTPVNEILAKLAAQQELLAQQQREIEEENRSATSSSATDPYANTPPTESALSDGRPDSAEVFRLKKELEQAHESMAQMNLQLTQSRAAKHTMEEAMGSPFPAAQQLAANLAGPNTTRANASTAPGNMNLYARTSSPFEPGSFNMPQQNTNEAPSYRGGPPRGSSYTGRSAYVPPAAPYHPPSYASYNGANLNGAPLPPGSFPGFPGGMPAPLGGAGTQLSPTAPEFGMGRGAGSWVAPKISNPPYSNSNTNPMEPLNYRQLLDRSMSCNWKYIVDKIVIANDQQASIFLQQKLKMGTPEQKFEMVQAIIDQAYPLMINRFGNFLVQRCFEHGTPEQIVCIAQAIRGNTLNLSMDAFGCHVVQKAFDSVPEEYKAIMVHELLRRIPETVIHRYACHVWQKLFELRWDDTPPQIMKYVNDALHGMWHEVALGETGSLVVQNIFENCLEEDKRPCIDEVLTSIDVVAHGQFGNWCIQHICEHGSVVDRTRAIDHVIRFATLYSMDQFASKVVEKCLKVCGIDFLDRYLERVCEADPDRPRIPLIDIASDQFGNYLIQYILTHGDPERRELVAVQVRKHMVSLRGSKYGSRVALLCSNTATATRPGPPPGMSAHRNGHGSFPGEGMRLGPGQPQDSYQGPYGGDGARFGGHGNGRPYMGRGGGYGNSYR